MRVCSWPRPGTDGWLLDCFDCDCEESLNEGDCPIERGRSMLLQKVPIDYLAHILRLSDLEERHIDALYEEISRRTGV